MSADRYDADGAEDQQGGQSEKVSDPARVVDAAADLRGARAVILFVDDLGAVPAPDRGGLDLTAAKITGLVGLVRGAALLSGALLLLRREFLATLLGRLTCARTCTATSWTFGSIRSYFPLWSPALTSRYSLHQVHGESI